MGTSLANRQPDHVDDFFLIYTNSPNHTTTMALCWVVPVLLGFLMVSSCHGNTCSMVDKKDFTGVAQDRLGFPTQLDGGLQICKTTCLAITACKATVAKNLFGLNYCIFFKTTTTVASKGETISVKECTAPTTTTKKTTTPTTTTTTKSTTTTTKPTTTTTKPTTTTTKLPTTTTKPTTTTTKPAGSGSNSEDESKESTSASSEEQD